MILKTRNYESEWVGLRIWTNGMSLMLYVYLLQSVHINQRCSDYEWIRVHS